MSMNASRIPTEMNATITANLKEASAPAALSRTKTA